MTLRVNDRHDVAVTARLHGPGDVVSIDTRKVVRTDPPHLASEFEPNYFPLVEFDRPDLPWLFTPATGDAAGKLRPWIVLVTVRRQPGVSITVDPASRRPVLRIAAPARPGAELPDLADSWAWAHAQVLDAGTGVPLADQLAAASTQNLSRLLCARAAGRRHRLRRLRRPGVRGRPAGRPRPADATARRGAPRPGLDAAATTPPTTSPCRCCTTGSSAPARPATSRRWPGGSRPARRRAGRPGRPLSVRGLGFGLPDLGTVDLGGALRPVGGPGRGPLPVARSPRRCGPCSTFPRPGSTGGSADPVVGPPIYGSRQAARSTVDRAPRRGWRRSTSTPACVPSPASAWPSCRSSRST